MNYISSPLTFQKGNEEVRIVRDIQKTKDMLNNLIELIVFTPRGTFSADPDFGFEYWNYEYTNIPFREFNNGQLGIVDQEIGITKEECQKSILNSLATYAPQLRQVNVYIELDTAEIERSRRNKVNSKYTVKILVEGTIDGGLGTSEPYSYPIEFLMEPTVRKVTI